MKKSVMVCLSTLAASTALAEDLSGVEEFVCSVSHVSLCAETGECFDVQPWEIDMPQFVVIDTKRRIVATTRASDQRRSTTIANLRRESAVIYLQGMEAGRAFSFIIDEATGLLTAAVARDGFSISVFGACTDADVKAATL
jgi:L-lactate utilization protein LutB